MGESTLALLSSADILPLWRRRSRVNRPLIFGAMLPASRFCFSRIGSGARAPICLHDVCACIVFMPSILHHNSLFVGGVIHRQASRDAIIFGQHLRHLIYSRPAGRLLLSFIAYSLPFAPAVVARTQPAPVGCAPGRPVLSPARSRASTAAGAYFHVHNASAGSPSPPLRASQPAAPAQGLRAWVHQPLMHPVFARFPPPQVSG